VSIIKYQPLDYWKLKAAFLEYQINNERLQKLVDENNRTISAKFTEAGFDPNGDYMFDDNQERIIQRESK
jgi:hypothetical protein